MRRLLLLLCLLAPLAVERLAAQGPTVPPSKPDDDAALSEAMSVMARERLVFEENRGQFDAEARYLLRAGGLNVWVSDRGLTYDLFRTEEVGNPSDRVLHDRADIPPHERETERIDREIRRTGHVVAMRFDGADPGARATAGAELPGRYNYLIGNDESKWATDVKRYDGVTIRGLYPGIDAVVTLDGGLPRYDLVVAAGADPELVRVRFEGVEKLWVDEEGALVMATSIGPLEHRNLLAYQTIGGARRRVECRFVVAEDGSVGFALGAYDRAHSLTIDPLVYSTFIGGNSYDYGQSIAVDGSGNAYVTGYTYVGTTAYPTTTGAYDAAHNGSADVFVTKLNAAGTALSYSTFIGGNASDVGRGIAVDGSGNAYVTGNTDGGTTAYPTTTGAYDAAHNGSQDVFVTKLSTGGCASTPTLDVTLTPSVLTTTGHSLQTITATASAVGGCAPTVELLSVTSSEPESGLDASDVADDIQGEDVGTNDASLQLRAERAPNGTGRTYTLTYRVTEGSTTVDVARTVTVPLHLGPLMPGGTNTCGAALAGSLEPLTGADVPIPFGFTSAATGVTIKVYDLRGKEAARPVNNASYAAGAHVVTWDGVRTNGPSIGGALPNGTYVVVLEACGFVDVRPLVIDRP